MATVKRTIRFTLVSSTLGVPQQVPLVGNIDFTYDSDEPLIATLFFGIDERGPVEWTFARHLLAEGLLRIAGMGDVTCWNTAEAYFISLSSSEGQAVSRFDADDIRDFLIDAEDLVPYGAEEDLVNAEIDGLLKDGAR